MRADFEKWYQQQDISARTCEAAFEAGYLLAANRGDKLSLSIQNDPLAISELLGDGNRERERLWKCLYDIVEALKDVVGQDAAMCSSEHLPALIRTLQLRGAPLPAQTPQTWQPILSKATDDGNFSVTINARVQSGDTIVSGDTVFRLAKLLTEAADSILRNPPLPAQTPQREPPR